jgi:uncharacterized protein
VGQGSAQRRFDAFGLVASHGEIAGKVDAFDLDRVQELLGEENGEVPPADVAWRIRGVTDALGHPALDIALDGEVPLECQRCMELFGFPVHQHTTVLLARDEKELEHLDASDEHEVMLAAAPLDALEIVEDELVLSLPYVPRCDRADCVAHDASPRTGEHASDDKGAASAFGALAALKRGKAPE